MSLAFSVGCVNRDGFLDGDKRLSRFVAAPKKAKEFLPEGWLLNASEAFRTELRLRLNQSATVATFHTRGDHDYAFYLLCKMEKWAAVAKAAASPHKRHGNHELKSIEARANGDDQIRP